MSKTPITRLLDAIDSLLEDEKNLPADTSWWTAPYRRLEKATRELKESLNNTQPPHCLNCHCADAVKGMTALSDYLDLHRGLLAVVYDSKTHDEAVAFATNSLRHKESIVEIGELVEIPDGFGEYPNTIFAEWNEERYKLPAGTKLYVFKK